MAMKKRGRPKGKRTKIVMRIKIRRKIIPISETRIKMIRKLEKPTARERYLATKYLGLPIPKGLREKAYRKKKKK